MAKKKKDFTFDKSLFRPCDWAQSFYDRMNQKFFGYKLPNVIVGFYYDPNNDDCYACSLTPLGAKYIQHIALNPHFTDWIKVVKTAILHEMIHVKLGNKYGHGVKFQKERRRLLIAGAFDDYL